MASKTEVRHSSDPEELEFNRLFEGQPRAEVPAAVPAPQGRGKAAAQDPLGAPLTIREVARLLGCSVWMVRRRCLPQGLPYFRVALTGKLMFYRNQVTQWVIERQRKGGD